jgi:DNA-binding CsgD family transcriptional regulator
MANYVKNSDLMRAIMESKEKGVLTPETINMFYLMIHGISKKMSYKDISDKLNLNLSTVKSQIRNGRAILVRETKKEFDAIDEMLM